jgi:hypothetical protein
MKQIWPTYAYSPTTNVLTLTGLNIDRDQLLLVTAADRGRIMYNFADSSVTASAFTSGANTALTLVATTAGLTTTAALVIYFDDQATSNTVTGTVELGPTSLNALESITVTMGQVTVTGGLTDVQLRASAVTVGGTITADLNTPNFVALLGDGPSPYAVNVGYYDDTLDEFTSINTINRQLPVRGTVTVGNTVTIAGTVTANPTGTQTIAGSVTLGAGTAQIGSVTASISNFPATQPISISSVTVGNSVTIASLPAISGTVTANTFALQGTAVTTSNFTSTTASTVLANYNATREVLTIFNEGAGNLHICAGATCTTIAYQVRLSAGDYYEVPNHQTTITHSAVFATAGTARVTQVS